MEPHAAIRSSLATPAQEYVNPELDSLVIRYTTPTEDFLPTNLRRTPRRICHHHSTSKEGN